MPLIYKNTKIWNMIFGNTDLTELDIDGKRVWENPLVYTMLADGTYSVQARRVSVVGSGKSDIISEGTNGYPCEINMLLEGLSIDVTSPTLRFSLSSYSGFSSEPSVKLVDGEIVVNGHSSTKLNICRVTVEFTDLPETLVIPSKFNGGAITKVAEGGFDNCAQLKRLVIPDTVTTYGDGGAVFKGCNSLEVISLPLNGQKVHYLFNGLSDAGASNSNPSALNALKASLPSSLSTVIVRGTKIAKKTVSYFPGLRSIYIASSVSQIERQAFMYLDSATCYCAVTQEPSGWEAGWNVNEYSYAWTSNFGVTIPTYVTG